MEFSHHGCVVGGDEVSQNLGAARRQHAFGADHILDCNRDSRQWGHLIASLKASVHGCGTLKRNIFGQC